MVVFAIRIVYSYNHPALSKCFNDDNDDNNDDDDAAGDDLLLELSS